MSNDQQNFEFENGTLLDASCKQVIADGVSSMLKTIGNSTLWWVQDGLEQFEAHLFGG